LVQLLAFAAVGAVAWVGYSSFKKHMEALKSQDAKKTKSKPKVVGDLKKDPKTGRYRIDDE